MASKLDKSIKDQIEPQYKLLGSAEKVGKQLNISPSTVVRHLKKLGYDFSMYQKHSLISYEEGLQKFPQEGSSLAKFCSKYQLSAAHFGRFLRKNGIHIPNLQNEVKFNDRIFDVIDTEEKAYWLGFIYADGYISSIDKAGFEISLKAEDSNHLHKFNRFMEHKHDNVKLGVSKCNGKEFQRCRWTVRNQHLWDTLNTLGCIPKKSLILQFPDISIFSTEDLIVHFIRGYFDGDGCISYANKEHTKICINIVGTEHMLDCINNYVPVKLYKTKKSNTDACSVSLSGTKAFKVVDYLYKNASIYLDRKYQRYLDFCRIYEES
jgi:hypothetical protein